MCDALIDGGQRCAAHARPRFERAVFDTPAWDEAAADYAATPSGRTDLTERLDEATRHGNSRLAAALRTALRVGEQRRAAYQDVRRTVAARREMLREQTSRGDPYWAAEMLGIIYSADNIVDRGRELFYDEDNTVEIAAARQHVIDLDTAADHLTAEFKDHHPQIPWRQLAKARDRYAHHYDDINRDTVWNILVEDFPSIRTDLRRFLGL